MTTVYQIVKMSTVYEVEVTNEGYTFIFRNGTYWLPAFNPEAAKEIIDLA